MAGRVLLGDSVLRSGKVTLHRIAGSNVTMDTADVASDGGFRFALPDPGNDDSAVVFASVRYAGILYLGSTRLATGVPVDDYELHVYDTTVVPLGGADLPMQSRSVVLQRGSGGWSVTDFLQVRIDGGRALAPGADGVVWQYPLPVGATDAEVADTEFAGRTGEVVQGRLAVTSALPPGERTIVVRYSVPDPYLDMPLPGITESLDVLIQEPAPLVELKGLSPAAPVQIEPGSTYRRYTATGLADVEIRAERLAERQPLPTGSLALVFGVVLLSAGQWSIRRAMPVRSAPRAARSVKPAARTEVLREIALLDEDFDAITDPSPESVAAHRKRRSALLGRL